jgi:glycosyltransferase involved in cell wall biosynthesis
MTNILILYAEVMPYNIPVYMELIKSGCRLYVIQLDRRKLTPYNHPTFIKNCTIRGISSFNNYKDFCKYCYKFDPQMVFVSEVMSPWYWRIAQYLRKKKKNIPITLCSDAQWTGSLSNWIKRVCFIFTYNLCFTNILCAGIWQHEYAQKLGFKKRQIIAPLYSANTALYNKVSINNKKGEYPKKFIYVGRFHPNKGLYYLFEAWANIKDKKGWNLTVIGNGPLKDFVRKQNNIEILAFQSQERICEIMSGTGCAIVPSIFEPWGLVIHESVAAGLPVIATANCGATSEFVINNYNGYVVEERKKEELKNAMIKIINSSALDLLIMSERSRMLSFRITPEIVSYSMLSLL